MAASEARLGHPERAAVALANFQGSVPKARTLADIRRWMNPLATLYGLRYLEQGHARGKIIIRAPPAQLW